MLEFALSNKDEFQRLLLMALTLIAFWKGAGPEKASAAALMLFLVQDPIDYWLASQTIDYSTILLRDLLLDCVVAGLLLSIALRANRIYTLWMAAWQLIAVLTHIGRIGSRSSEGLAYAILMYLPSYLLLPTLAVGMAAHIKRVGRVGEYSSWWNDCPPWKPARQ